MTILIDLLSLREDWDFEAKLATGRDGQGELPKSFWETYVAMANTDGGVIALGVKEQRGKFLIHGIPDLDRVQTQLWNLLNNPQKVSLNLLTRSDVRVISEGGKQVLVIQVPRASRRQRPIHLGTNPMTGTYVRAYDGDRLCTPDEVRRMILDADPNPYDRQILDQTSLDDLDRDSLKAYRNLFRSWAPDHPFLQNDDQRLLEQLGGWAKDRQKGMEGLTVAGLLMFGQEATIKEFVPYFQLDYRELPHKEQQDAPRWLDRVTLDGRWSGNLFDFLRKVMPKLTRDLKVPFELNESLQRVEDTVVHRALREALINTLVHADYSDSRGIRIFKRSDGFEFTNPGRPLLPIRQIWQGGTSDCRNPSIQKMFQMLGYGEKAGSGFPTIVKAWKEQHWWLPLLKPAMDLNDTHLELKIISLLPDGVWSTLQQRFHGAFQKLDEVSRLALATAMIEKGVSNQRLQEICELHPTDITKLLQKLVQRKFLLPHSQGRGTWYELTGNSPHTEGNSPHTEGNSPHTEGNSPHTGMGTVPEIVTKVATQARAGREVVRGAIAAYCSGQFQTLTALAKVLNRHPETLRYHYLSKMVKEGSLELHYPQRLNHPDQAYRTKST